MSKKDAFIEIFNKTYPSQGIGNYKYKCSTLTMEDNGYYFFSIKNNSSIKILGANINSSIKTLVSSNIIEIIIPEIYIDEIVNELKKYYNDYLISK